MTNSIRTIFWVVCVLYSFAVKGQQSLDSIAIARLWVQHPCHCDSALQVFEQFYRHDESTINLVYLSVETKSDSLVLRGRLTDNFSEGIEAKIYLAALNASRCDLKQLQTLTDRNGRFNLCLHQSSQLSLYFVSLGFRDASIQVQNLLSVLKDK